MKGLTVNRNPRIFVKSCIISRFVNTENTDNPNLLRREKSTFENLYVDHFYALFWACRGRFFGTSIIVFL